MAANRVFFILMIIWMAVIFGFSCRNGDESTEDSYYVGMTVGQLVIPAFNDLSEEEQLEFAARVDHPVRKTAHALEYALLGALTLGAVYKRDRRAYINLLTAWLVAAVYAASDEIHQLFVAGRSGQLSDVILDSAGALVGILICLAALRIRKGRK